TTRTSWMPGRTSAGIVTLNFAVVVGGACICCLGAGFLGSAGGAGFVLTNSAFIPGALNIRDCGTSNSCPLSVTSTVLPAFAPGGVTTSKRGCGIGGTCG